MEKIKVKGIVVGEQNYSETSKILKIFIRELGIVSVMSKGCKKIKSPLHEASNKLVFATFDISYRDNAMSTLVSVSDIHIFKNIIMDIHDIDRKMYAFYLTDLVNQVIKQERISDYEKNILYDIYLNSLYKIDEKFNPKIIYDIVRVKYLSLLGVEPNLDSCSSCGRKDNIITCSSSSFGYICRDCYNGEKIIKEDSLKMIKMLFCVDISKIRKLDIDEDILKDVSMFLDDYYEEHTGIYFKSKKNNEILEKIIGIVKA